MLRYRPVFETAPCTNLDKTVKQDDNTYPLQRHVPCHRRCDVLCHVVGRFPSRRHQPPRHVPALQGGLPDQLRNRLQDQLARTTACASTARCSRTTGTTSSIRSSAQMVSPRSATPARRAIKGIETDISGPSPTRFTLSAAFAAAEGRVGERLAARPYDPGPTRRSVHRLRDRLRSPNIRRSSPPEGTRLPMHAGIQGATLTGATNSHGRPGLPFPGLAWVYNGDCATRSAHRRTRVARQYRCRTRSSTSHSASVSEKLGAELFVKNAFDERAVARCHQCSLQPDSDPPNPSRCVACSLTPSPTVRARSDVTFTKKF